MICPSLILYFTSYNLPQVWYFTPLTTGTDGPTDWLTDWPLLELLSATINRIQELKKSEKSYMEQKDIIFLPRLEIIVVNAWRRELSKQAATVRMDKKKSAMMK